MFMFIAIVIMKFKLKKKHILDSFKFVIPKCYYSTVLVGVNVNLFPTLYSKLCRENYIAESSDSIPRVTSKAAVSIASIDVDLTTKYPGIGKSQGSFPQGLGRISPP